MTSKKKNLDPTWNDLNERQQKIIKQKTLGLRILGFFIPLIYLLWARAYKELGIYFLIGFIIGGGLGSTFGSESPFVLFFWTLYILIFRILILTNGSKRAFNHSKGYLKNLV